MFKKITKMITFIRKHLVSSILIVCAILGATGAVYTIKTYYVTIPSAQSEKKAKTEPNNTIADADNKNRIKMDNHKSKHQQKPPLSDKKTATLDKPEKEQKITTPPINATDSNVVVGPVTGDVNQTLITTKAKSRLLKPEQIEWLTNFLKDKPKGFIQVGWTIDGEASVLGPQLALILGNAGWKYKEASSNFSSIGISLITAETVTDINALSPPAAALATGLINVGLDVKIINSAPLPPNTYFLGVGQKE
jgi:hypothetical protein